MARSFQNFEFDETMETCLLRSKNFVSFLNLLMNLMNGYYYIAMFLVSICKIVRVKHRSFLPDSIMMNAAISACEKAEEWQWALHLLDTCWHAANCRARSF